MIHEALGRVTAGEELSRAQAREMVREMMSGTADPLATAGLLAALRTRGESLDEVVGAAQAIRALAVALPEAPPGAVDTCGTGGDHANTFNISTTAALVVAGAGVPVAKHGNRRASSLCGSAEVLEALGVRLTLPPEQMAAAVHEVGIGFLFARTCHPAFAAVAPVRTSLGIPTLFNRIGPLCNPMRVRRHLVGVGDEAQLDAALSALVELGAERAWVVHGEDGMDEISSCAPTQVRSYAAGEFRSFVLEPGKYVPPADVSELCGGDAKENAEIVRGILSSEPGPRRDVVLLNAGAALCAAAHPHAIDLEVGIRLAKESIDSGAARAVLDRWVEYTARAGEGQEA